MQLVTDMLIDGRGTYTYDFLGDVARITFVPNKRVRSVHAQCTLTTRDNAMRHFDRITESRS